MREWILRGGFLVAGKQCIQGEKYEQYEHRGENSKFHGDTKLGLGGADRGGLDDFDVEVQ